MRCSVQQQIRTDTALPGFETVIRNTCLAAAGRPAGGGPERGVDAFSTGKDIFFARGAFDRSDPASRGLLAHELSHSMQQGHLLDWFKR